MRTQSGKKKLTRGEKMLLVAPLFVLLLLSLDAFYKNLQPLLFARNFPNDIQNPQGEVLSLHSSPDGRQIIARSFRYEQSFVQAVFNNKDVPRTGNLSSWDLKTKRLLWSEQFTESLSLPVFSPDGNTFVVVVRYYLSPGIRSDIELRNTRNGQLLWKVSRGNSVGVRSFTRDGKQIVVTHDYKTAELLDAATGVLRHIFPVPKTSSFPRFESDGQTLLIVAPLLPNAISARPGLVPSFVEFAGPIGPSRQKVQAFDLTTGQLWNSFLMPERPLIFPLSSPEMLLSQTNQLQVWDYRTGRLRRSFKTRFDSLLYRRCISQNRRWLFNFSNQSNVVDLQTGKTLWITSTVSEPSFCEFSPDGRWLGTSEWDRENNCFHVTLRDTKTGLLLHSLDVPNYQNVLRVTFTGDSRAMLFGIDDHIYIWDTNSGATKT